MELATLARLGTSTEALRSAQNRVRHKMGDMLCVSDQGGALEPAPGIVPLIAAPMLKGKEQKYCGNGQNNPEKHGFNVGARVDCTSWRLCPC